ncbi:hypothetical protein [Klebsiella pneumoniae]|uniref:hypothetical protein n=1 Tax=Klebsiella pneumoniae TaxID=573 RepID=UPI0032AFA123
MTITETQKTAQLAADAAVRCRRRIHAGGWSKDIRILVLPPSKPRMQLDQLFYPSRARLHQKKIHCTCNRGGVARDEAVTAASNASEYAQNKFTFYKTPSDPDGTPVGLAATTTVSHSA